MPRPSMKITLPVLQNTVLPYRNKHFGFKKRRFWVSISMKVL